MSSHARAGALYYGQDITLGLPPSPNDPRGFITSAGEAHPYLSLRTAAVRQASTAQSADAAVSAEHPPPLGADSAANANTAPGASANGNIRQKLRRAVSPGPGGRGHVSPTINSIPGPRGADGPHGFSLDQHAGSGNVGTHQQMHAATAAIAGTATSTAGVLAANAEFLNFDGCVFTLCRANTEAFEGGGGGNIFGSNTAPSSTQDPTFGGVGVSSTGNSDTVASAMAPPAVVSYGSKVCLLHRQSGLFVSLQPGEPSETDPTCNAVTLVDPDNATPTSHFTFVPRFKIHGEGDTVCAKDAVMLQLHGKPLFLHLSFPTAAPGLDDTASSPGGSEFLSPAGAGASTTFPPGGRSGASGVFEKPGDGGVGGKNAAGSASPFLSMDTAEVNAGPMPSPWVVHRYDDGSTSFSHKAYPRAFTSSGRVITDTAPATGEEASAPAIPGLPTIAGAPVVLFHREREALVVSTATLPTHLVSHDKAPISDANQTISIGGAANNGAATSTSSTDHGRPAGSVNAGGLSADPPGLSSTASFMFRKRSQLDLRLLQQTSAATGANYNAVYGASHSTAGGAAQSNTSAGDPNASSGTIGRSGALGVTREVQGTTPSSSDNAATTSGPGAVQHPQRPVPISGQAATSTAVLVPHQGYHEDISFDTDTSVSCGALWVLERVDPTVGGPLRFSTGSGQLPGAISTASTVAAVSGAGGGPIGAATSAPAMYGQPVGADRLASKLLAGAPSSSASRVTVSAVGASSTSRSESVELARRFAALDAARLRALSLDDAMIDASVLQSSGPSFSHWSPHVGHGRGLDAVTATSVMTASQAVLSVAEQKKLCSQLAQGNVAGFRVRHAATNAYLTSVAVVRRRKIKTLPQRSGSHQPQTPQAPPGAHGSALLPNADGLMSPSNHAHANAAHQGSNIVAAITEHYTYTVELKLQLRPPPENDLELLDTVFLLRPFFASTAGNGADNGGESAELPGLFGQGSAVSEKEFVRLQHFTTGHWLSACDEDGLAASDDDSDTDSDDSQDSDDVDEVQNAGDASVGASAGAFDIPVRLPSFRASGAAVVPPGGASGAKKSSLGRSSQSSLSPTRPTDAQSPKKRGSTGTLSSPNRTLSPKKSKSKLSAIVASDASVTGDFSPSGTARRGSARPAFAATSGLSDTVSSLTGGGTHTAGGTTNDLKTNDASSSSFTADKRSSDKNVGPGAAADGASSGAGVSAGGFCEKLRLVPHPESHDAVAIAHVSPQLQRDVVKLFHSAQCLRECVSAFTEFTEDAFHAAIEDTDGDDDDDAPTDTAASTGNALESFSFGSKTAAGSGGSQQSPSGTMNTAEPKKRTKDPKKWTREERQRSRFADALNDFDISDFQLQVAVATNTLSNLIVYCTESNDDDPITREGLPKPEHQRTLFDLQLHTLCLELLLAPFADLKQRSWSTSGPGTTADTQHSESTAMRRQASDTDGNADGGGNASSGDGRNYLPPLPLSGGPVKLSKLHEDIRLRPLHTMLRLAYRLLRQMCKGSGIFAAKLAPFLPYMHAQDGIGLHVADTVLALFTDNRFIPARVVQDSAQHYVKTLTTKSRSAGYLRQLAAMCHVRGVGNPASQTMICKLTLAHGSPVAAVLLGIVITPDREIAVALPASSSSNASSSSVAARRRSSTVIGAPPMTDGRLRPRSISPPVSHRGGQLSSDRFAVDGAAADRPPRAPSGPTGGRSRDSRSGAPTIQEPTPSDGTRATSSSRSGTRRNHTLVPLRQFLLTHTDAKVIKFVEAQFELIASVALGGIPSCVEAVQRRFSPQLMDVAIQTLLREIPPPDTGTEKLDAVLGHLFTIALHAFAMPAMRASKFAAQAVQSHTGSAGAQNTATTSSSPSERTAGGASSATSTSSPSVAAFAPAVSSTMLCPGSSLRQHEIPTFSGIPDTARLKALKDAATKVLEGNTRFVWEHTARTKLVARVVDIWVAFAETGQYTETERDGILPTLLQLLDGHMDLPTLRRNRAEASWDRFQRTEHSAAVCDARRRVCRLVGLLLRTAVRSAADLVIVSLGDISTVTRDKRGALRSLPTHGSSGKSSSDRERRSSSRTKGGKKTRRSTNSSSDDSDAKDTRRRGAAKHSNKYGRFAGRDDKGSGGITSSFLLRRGAPKEKASATTVPPAVLLQQKTRAALNTAWHSVSSVFSTGDLVTKLLDVTRYDDTTLAAASLELVVELRQLRHNIARLAAEGIGAVDGRAVSVDFFDSLFHVREEFANLNATQPAAVFGDAVTILLHMIKSGAVPKPVPVPQGTSTPSSTIGSPQPGIPPLGPQSSTSSSTRDVSPSHFAAAQQFTRQGSFLPQKAGQGSAGGNANASVVPQAVTYRRLVHDALAHHPLPKKSGAVSATGSGAGSPSGASSRAGSWRGLALGLRRGASTEDGGDGSGTPRERTGGDSSAPSENLRLDSTAGSTGGWGGTTSLASSSSSLSRGSDRRSPGATTTTSGDATSHWSGLRAAVKVLGLAKSVAAQRQQSDAAIIDVDESGLPKDVLRRLEASGHWKLHDPLLAKMQSLPPSHPLFPILAEFFFYYTWWQPNAAALAPSLNVFLQGLTHAAASQHCMYTVVAIMTATKDSGGTVSKELLRRLVGLTIAESQQSQQQPRASFVRLLNRTVMSASMVPTKVRDLLLQLQNKNVFAQLPNMTASWQDAQLTFNSALVTFLTNCAAGNVGARHVAQRILPSLTLLALLDMDPPLPARHQLVLFQFLSAVFLTFDDESMHERRNLQQRWSLDPQVWIVVERAVGHFREGSQSLRLHRYSEFSHRLDFVFVGVCGFVLNFFREFYLHGVNKDDRVGQIIADLAAAAFDLTEEALDAASTAKVRMRQSDWDITRRVLQQIAQVILDLDYRRLAEEISALLLRVEAHVRASKANPATTGGLPNATATNSPQEAAVPQVSRRGRDSSSHDAPSSPSKRRKGRGADVGEDDGHATASIFSSLLKPLAMFSRSADGSSSSSGRNGPSSKHQKRAKEKSPAAAATVVFKPKALQRELLRLTDASGELDGVYEQSGGGSAHHIADKAFAAIAANFAPQREDVDALAQAHAHAQAHQAHSAERRGSGGASATDRRRSSLGVQGMRGDGRRRSSIGGPSQGRSQGIAPPTPMMMSSMIGTGGGHGSPAKTRAATDDWTRKALLHLRAGELSEATSVGLLHIFRALVLHVERSRGEKMLQALQTRLDSLGGMRVVMTLTDVAAGNAIALRCCLRFGIALLEGGNLDVQNSMLNYFEAFDERFFHAIRDILSAATATAKHRNSVKGQPAIVETIGQREGQRPSQSPTAAESPKSERPPLAVHSTPPPQRRNKHADDDDSDNTDSDESSSSSTSDTSSSDSPGQHAGATPGTRMGADSGGCGENGGNAPGGDGGDGEQEDAPPSGALGNVRDTLRLLQLMCEGHNLRMQNYVREQPDNLHSVNILKAVLELMHELCRNIDATTFVIVVQGFALLTEFCQGPCVANQLALISGNACHLINTAFRYRGPDRDELKTIATTTLLSLLEGSNDESVYARVLSQVPVAFVGRLMDGVHSALPPGWHQRVQHDDEHEAAIAVLFDLLAFLKQVKPYAAEPALVDAVLARYSHITPLLGCIEVERNGSLERVYFRTPFLSQSLTEQSKNQLLWNVDRATRGSKLSDFVRRSDALIVEMEHAHAVHSGLTALLQIRGIPEDHDDHDGSPIDISFGGLISLIGKLFSRGQTDAHSSSSFGAHGRAEPHSPGLSPRPFEDEWSSRRKGGSVSPDATWRGDFTFGTNPGESAFEMTHRPSSRATGSSGSPAATMSSEQQDAEHSSALAEAIAWSESCKALVSVIVAVMSSSVAVLGRPFFGWLRRVLYHFARRWNTEIVPWVVHLDADSFDNAALILACAVNGVLAMSPDLTPFQFETATSDAAGVGFTLVATLCGVSQVSCCLAAVVLDSVVHLPLHWYSMERARGGKPLTSFDLFTPNEWSDSKLVSGLTRPATALRLFWVAVGVAGLLISPYVFALSLLALIHRSAVLRNIITAVTQNGRTLLLTLGLGFVLMYLFSIVGLHAFPNAFTSGANDDGDAHPSPASGTEESYTSSEALGYTRSESTAVASGTSAQSSPVQPSVTSAVESAAVPSKRKVYDDYEDYDEEEELAEEQRSIEEKGRLQEEQSNTEKNAQKESPVKSKSSKNDSSRDTASLNTNDNGAGARKDQPSVSDGDVTPVVSVATVASVPHSPPSGLPVDEPSAAKTGMSNVIASAQARGECSTLLRCMSYIMLHGLRQGGGIGDLMQPAAWGTSEYLPRMMYDFLFFAVLNVVFLNILFGIIIDTFAELRDEKRRVEEDMTTTCFICGLDSDTFDRSGSSMAAVSVSSSFNGPADPNQRSWYLLSHASLFGALSDASANSSPSHDVEGSDGEAHVSRWRLLSVLGAALFRSGGHRRTDAADADDGCESALSGGEKSEGGFIGGFSRHIHHEHNLWQYLFFFHHLRRKDRNDYTGQESYVAGLLERGDLGFFPHSKALSVAASVAARSAAHDDDAALLGATGGAHAAVTAAAAHAVVTTASNALTAATTANTDAAGAATSAATAATMAQSAVARVITAMEEQKRLQQRQTEEVAATVVERVLLALSSVDVTASLAQVEEEMARGDDAELVMDVSEHQQQTMPAGGVGVDSASVAHSEMSEPHQPTLPSVPPTPVPPSMRRSHPASALSTPDADTTQETAGPPNQQNDGSSLLPPSQHRPAPLAHGGPSTTPPATPSQRGGVANARQDAMRALAAAIGRAKREKVLFEQQGGGQAGGASSSAAPVDSLGVSQHLHAQGGGITAAPTPRVLPPPQLLSVSSAGAPAMAGVPISPLGCPTPGGLPTSPFAAPMVSSSGSSPQFPPNIPSQRQSRRTTPTASSTAATNPQQSQNQHQQRIDDSMQGAASSSQSAVTPRSRAAPVTRRSPNRGAPKAALLPAKPSEPRLPTPTDSRFTTRRDDSQGPQGPRVAGQVASRNTTLSGSGPSSTEPEPARTATPTRSTPVRRGRSNSMLTPARRAPGSMSMSPRPGSRVPMKMHADFYNRVDVAGRDAEPQPHVQPTSAGSPLIKETETEPQPLSAPQKDKAAVMIDTEEIATEDSSKNPTPEATMAAPPAAQQEVAPVAAPTMPTPTAAGVPAAEVTRRTEESQATGPTRSGSENVVPSKLTATTEEPSPSADARDEAVQHLTAEVQALKDTLVRERQAMLHLKEENTRLRQKRHQSPARTTTGGVASVAARLNENLIRSTAVQTDPWETGVEVSPKDGSPRSISRNGAGSPMRSASLGLHATSCEHVEVSTQTLAEDERAATFERGSADEGSPVDASAAADDELAATAGSLSNVTLPRITVTCDADSVAPSASASAMDLLHVAGRTGCAGLSHARPAGVDAACQSVVSTLTVGTTTKVEKSVEVPTTPGLTRDAVEKEVLTKCGFQDTDEVALALWALRLIRAVMVDPSDVSAAEATTSSAVDFDAVKVKLLDLDGAESRAASSATLDPAAVTEVRPKLTPSSIAHVGILRQCCSDVVTAKENADAEVAKLRREFDGMAMEYEHTIEVLEERNRTIEELQQQRVAPRRD